VLLIECSVRIEFDNDEQSLKLYSTHSYDEWYIHLGPFEEVKGLYEGVQDKVTRFTKKNTCI